LTSNDVLAIFNEVLFVKAWALHPAPTATVGLAS
jgi:hypothetical protein